MTATTLCYHDGLPIEEGDAVLYGWEFLPSKVVEMMYSAGLPDAIALEDATGRQFLCHSSRIGGQINHVERKSVDFVVAGFDFLHKKANDGSMRAQYALGHLYHNGKGVKADISMALKFWEQAAESNCAPALYGLGQLYENGDGVSVNLEKAISYYMRAAQEEFPPADEALKLLRQTKDHHDLNR